MTEFSIPLFGESKAIGHKIVVSNKEWNGMQRDGIEIILAELDGKPDNFQQNCHHFFQLSS